MKRAVISLFGAMIAIVASQIVALIVHQNQVDNLQAQITSVRGQESAMRADYLRQLAALITCGDLQHLQMSGIDNAGNQVSVGYDNGGGPDAVVLPEHCINH